MRVQPPLPPNLNPFGRPGFHIKTIEPQNSGEWLRANIMIAAIDSVGVGWAHWTFKRFDTHENAALLRITGSLHGRQTERVF
jgi:hypothetical protein